LGDVVLHISKSTITGHFFLSNILNLITSSLISHIWDSFASQQRLTEEGGMSSLAGTRNTANEGPTRGRTILQPISSNIPRIGTGHVPIIKSTSRLGTNNKPTVSASSIAGTTTTAKSTIVPEIKLQLPVPLGDDNDFISENDEEEDQHLMAILQKLKQVQTTTTESKQRLARLWDS
jgi:hypothetical protein